MGRGDISVWWDNWLGEGPLTWMYPITDPEAWVKDFWKHGAWDQFELYRILPADVVHRILALDVHIDDSSEDVMYWKELPSGAFQVGSVVKHLLDYGSSWFFRQVWVKQIPVKMSFTLWRVILGKMPLLDVLFRFQIQGPSWCFCWPAKQVETL